MMVITLQWPGTGAIREPEVGAGGGGGSVALSKFLVLMALE